MVSVVVILNLAVSIVIKTPRCIFLFVNPSILTISSPNLVCVMGSFVEYVKNSLYNSELNLLIVGSALSLEISLIKLIKLSLQLAL